MNRNLKIFNIIATKFSTISFLNLSEIIENINMIKYGNLFNENRQNDDFYSKNGFLFFPTLKGLVLPRLMSALD